MYFNTLVISCSLFRINAMISRTQHMTTLTELAATRKWSRNDLCTVFVW